MTAYIIQSALLTPISLLFLLNEMRPNLQSSKSFLLENIVHCKYCSVWAEISCQLS